MPRLRFGLVWCSHERKQKGRSFWEHPLLALPSCQRTSSPAITHVVNIVGEPQFAGGTAGSAGGAAGSVAGAAGSTSGVEGTTGSTVGAAGSAVGATGSAVDSASCAFGASAPPATPEPAEPPPASPEVLSLALQPNRIVTHAISTSVLNERTNFIFPNLSKNAFSNQSQPGNCLTRQLCDLVNLRKHRRKSTFRPAEIAEVPQMGIPGGLEFPGRSGKLAGIGRV